jgi:uncharacterized protein (TIGR02217 family)
MVFHEVVFPLSMAYGSSGGPGYQTSVVQLLSGATERNSRWQAPLLIFDARQAVRSAEDVAILTDFFHARRGSAAGFRLLDPRDHSTGPNGNQPPTASDVLLGFGDGSQTSWQLVKRYAAGTSYEWARTIRKPIEGSVLVSVGGLATTSFAVDHTTGIVVLTTPPAAGVQVRAGFEFHVPVIFGPEADRLLNINFAAYNDARLAIPMIEDRSDAQAPAGFRYGNSMWSENPGVDLFVHPRVARLWVISGSISNGAGWRLPDAAGLYPGGVHAVLSNQTAGAVPVRDYQGTLLTQVPAFTTSQVYLARTPAGQKSWLISR